MTRHQLGTDDAAVSEASAVLVLVVFTVLITASVGVNVFFAAEEEEDPSATPTANFSYEHIPSGSVLLITHDRGDEFRAGNLTVSGPAGQNVTWATLAASEANETVGPGDTVQLSRANAWGEAVAEGDRVRIYYVGPNGTRTQISNWTG
ncbi:type IV pilin [Haloarculaceae archaeon H-GB2-1]|nr:type IV pilin [Haloarculaceae archaeon H-GB1-1]MEA5387021.1 type IV pilin [Haloarculaceae archaeon H-GB11]MEA5408523.1 type IV pilin [Haloarculaceae archaeon H-GB2-1]